MTHTPREKRLWRELFRVLNKTEERVFVVIPSWDYSQEVDFSKNEFSPTVWDALKIGGRYFAQINSDAKSMGDLEISSVEIPIVKTVQYMDDGQLMESAKSLPTQELVDEILRLRNAIRDHQSQTGDNLCWLNDLKLWQNVDINAQYPHDKVPGESEFLGNCKKYHESRVKGLPYSEAKQETHAVTKDGKRVGP